MSAGKIILSLAAVLCLIQAISARPKSDGSLLESVKYDLTKKCAGLEKDMDKESMNIKHKLEKESMKLLKKALKEGSPECIESAKLQAEEQLEEKITEIQDTIQELKDSLESELQPELGLPEIMSFRNNFKKNLQMCKKSGKTDLKAVQNSFSVAGKACLV